LKSLKPTTQKPSPTIQGAQGHAIERQALPAKPLWFEGYKGSSHTVDGSELRRSPVKVGSLSHDLEGFIHPSKH